MGHYKDLGSLFDGDINIVGLSAKCNVFTDEERIHIAETQWEHSVKFMLVKSVGETIRAAYDQLPDGKKNLVIVLGWDRIKFAQGIKKSLEQGKIKEMEGRMWNDIRIVHPSDQERSHRLSGTRMREAARNGEFLVFAEHIGTMFSNHQVSEYMERIREAIEKKHLAIKRY